MRKGQHAPLLVRQDVAANFLLPPLHSFDVREHPVRLETLGEFRCVPTGR